MLRLLFLVLFASSTYAIDCKEPKLYDKVVNASEKIVRWNLLPAYFDTYQECDMGEVALKHSSMVEQLFLNQWSEFWKSGIYEKQPRIWTFLLKHIDSSWLQGDEHWFILQVNEDCPEKYSHVCEEIKLRIQEL